MSTEIPNKKTKRRRYRTRMFDNRFSFPTTSEQVRQLQAESDAQGRSVASLIREAIDEFLPRLRGRRRKRRTPLEPPAARGQGRQSPPAGRAAALRRSAKARGGPHQDRSPGQTVKWFYGPNDALEIDFQSGRWHDPERKKGGSILELVMREKQLGQTEAFAWIKEQ